MQWREIAVALTIHARAAFDQCSEVGNISAKRDDMDWPVSEVSALIHVVEWQIKEFEQHILTKPPKHVLGRRSLFGFIRHVRRRLTINGPNLAFGSQPHQVSYDLTLKQRTCCRTGCPGLLTVDHCTSQPAWKTRCQCNLNHAVDKLTLRVRVRFS